MPADNEADVIPEKTEAELEAERTEAAELEQAIKDAEENLDDLSKEDLAAALLKIAKTKEDLAKTNSQLFARAKKAEGFEQVDGKWVKKEKRAEPPKEPKPEEPANAVTIDLLDERLLQDKGMSSEDIAKLKFIQAGAKAQGRNISLVEAQQDELFKAYRANKEAEDRSQKAQIKPGGGSRSEAIKKVAEMSEEDHKKLAEEKANEVLSSM